MKPRGEWNTTVVRKLLLVNAALTVFLITACNSSKTPEAKVPTKQNAAAVPQNSTEPDIDLNCVISHLQNPPESFHYSFSDASDNPWSEEADVTPAMIDGSFTNNSMPAPVQLHDTPRDMPHKYQWVIARMASLFALVRGTSAVVNEGPEKGLNGYDTVKVSIDTARECGRAGVVHRHPRSRRIREGHGLGNSRRLPGKDRHGRGAALKGWESIRKISLRRSNGAKVNTELLALLRRPSRSGRHGWRMVACSPSGTPL